MVAEIAALDLWTLFVQYTFGNFWMASLGLILVQFIIMGVLGRMSIWTVTWICIMFILAMTLGYAYVTLNILITLALLVAFYFSMTNYINSNK